MKRVESFSIVFIVYSLVYILSLYEWCVYIRRGTYPLCGDFIVNKGNGAQLNK